MLPPTLGDVLQLADFTSCRRHPATFFNLPTSPLPATLLSSLPKPTEAANCASDFSLLAALALGRSEQRRTPKPKKNEVVLVPRQAACMLILKKTRLLIKSATYLSSLMKHVMLFPRQNHIYSQHQRRTYNMQSNNHKSMGL